MSTNATTLSGSQTTISGSRGNYPKSSSTSKPTSAKQKGISSQPTNFISHQTISNTSKVSQTQPQSQPYKIVEAGSKGTSFLCLPNQQVSADQVQYGQIVLTKVKDFA